MCTLSTANCASSKRVHNISKRQAIGPFMLLQSATLTSTSSQFVSADQSTMERSQDDPMEFADVIQVDSEIGRVKKKSRVRCKLLHGIFS